METPTGGFPLLPPQGSNHTVAVWKPTAAASGTAAALRRSNHTVAVWKRFLRPFVPPRLSSSNHTVAVWKLGASYPEEIGSSSSNHTVAVWKPGASSLYSNTWQFKSHRRGVETGNWRPRSPSPRNWFKSHRRGVETSASYFPSGSSSARSNHTVAVWKPEGAFRPSSFSSSNHTVAVWKRSISPLRLSSHRRFKSHRRGVET